MVSVPEYKPGTLPRLRTPRYQDCLRQDVNADDGDDNGDNDGDNPNDSNYDDDDDKGAEVSLDIFMKMNFQSETFQLKIFISD